MCVCVCVCQGSKAGTCTCILNVHKDYTMYIKIDLCSMF